MSESVNMPSFGHSWGWRSNSSSTKSIDHGLRELDRDLIPDNEIIYMPSSNPDVQRIQKIAQGLRGRLLVAEEDLSAAYQHMRYADDASVRVHEEINSLHEHLTAVQVSNVQLSLSLDNSKVSATKSALAARRLRIYSGITSLLLMFCLIRIVLS